MSYFPSFYILSIFCWALSRGGTFGTLPPMVAWMFTEGTARAETRARLEAQQAFSALVQRLPG